MKYSLRKQQHLLFLIFAFSQFTIKAQVVSTLSHVGVGANIEGLCVDANGNVYTVDKANDVINITTPAGVTSLYAGSGKEGNADGNGSNASFKNPAGIAIDKSGNLFVTDYDNNTIRKIDTDKNVTTFAGSGIQGTADGTGKNATFTNPWGICITKSGDLLVTDHWGYKIRRITPDGVVSTFTTQAFTLMFGITEGPDGKVYTAIRNFNIVYRFAADGTYEGIHAGQFRISGNADGDVSTATFGGPQGLYMDTNGDLYITDNGNQRIRKVNAAGQVSTVAGNGGISCKDGAANVSNFWGPSGILKYKDELYIADFFCGSIRKISNLPTSVNTPATNQPIWNCTPNPTSQNITLQLKGYTAKNTLQLTLSNLDGKVLFSDRIYSDQQQCTLPYLEQGLYFIELRDPELGSIGVQSLMIMHH